MAMTKGPGFIFVSSFNDDTLRDFYGKFLEIEANPDIPIIPVVISSYGGEVYSILAMRDIIKSSEKPVMTIGLGKAMSAGASLLASGTKGLRFVAPNIRIMIHEVSAGASGKATDMKNRMESIESLNDLFIKTLSEDLNTKADSLKKMFKNKANVDWYLTAEEAVKMNVADKIGVPRLFSEAPAIGVALKEDKTQVSSKKTKKPKK